MIKEKDKKSKIIGRSYQIAVVLAVSCILVMAYGLSDINEDVDKLSNNIENVLDPSEEYETRELDWIRTMLPWLGDADPGAGNSGVMEVYIYPHSGDPGNDYATNITGAASYGSSDEDTVSCGTNIPHSITFDIVIKVRWNTTHAFNTSTGLYELALVRGNSTCSDLSYSDILMNEVNITDTSDNTNYIWVHYYLADVDGGAGPGFTISRGQEVDPVSFTFDYFG